MRQFSFRNTPGGNLVAMLTRVTITLTQRVHAAAAGQLNDSAALFLRCVAWSQLAGHVAESFAKSTRAVYHHLGVLADRGHQLASN